jgi:hypothetical protein
VPIDRFEHCNFTADEALFAFAIMLFYDGALQGMTGSSTLMTSSQQAAFDRRARAAACRTSVARGR